MCAHFCLEQLSGRASSEGVKATHAQYVGHTTQGDSVTYGVHISEASLLLFCHKDQWCFDRNQAHSTHMLLKNEMISPNHLTPAPHPQIPAFTYLSESNIICSFPNFVFLDGVPHSPSQLLQPNILQRGRLCERNVRQKQP